MTRYPTRRCFISHTWANGQHDFARLLYRRLNRYKGITCWLDEEKIVPGVHIYDRIAAALDQETDLTLCVLSPEYLRSRNCKAELSRAARLARDGNHAIIPVVLAPLPPGQMPLELEGLLCADFSLALEADGNVSKPTFLKELTQLVRGIRATVSQSQPQPGSTGPASTTVASPTRARVEPRKPHLKTRGLRILYLHRSPRSTGIEYIESCELYDELIRRGHRVQPCWAVLPEKDTFARVSADVLTPAQVIELSPDLLLFENGLLVGEPRVPLELMKQLQSRGCATLIFLGINEYASRKAEYDSFLAGESLRLFQPNTDRDEQPVCVQGANTLDIRLGLDRVRSVPPRHKKQIERGVTDIALDYAMPMADVSGILLWGDGNTRIKCYSRMDIHRQPSPVLGVLRIHNHRVVAFVPAIPLSREPSTVTFFANLAEVLADMSAELHASNVPPDLHQIPAPPARPDPPPDDTT